MPPVFTPSGYLIPQDEVTAWVLAHINSHPLGARAAADAMLPSFEAWVNGYDKEVRQ